MATVTGADAIARALKDEGLRYFFNLPGNGVYPMLDPIVDAGIDYILGLHEASTLSIADGYARGSGTVPFVNFYMVPGTANALSAFYIAYKDRVPLVVTATEQARATVGRDAYASAPDLEGIVRQFAKWTFRVPSPERLEESIHRAFTVAATHPQGPVFLTFPFDLLPAPVRGTPNEPTRKSAVPAYGGPPAEVVHEVAALLGSAERILFICGRDVVSCDAVAEVEALAHTVGAAVVSESWTGVLAFPRPHELGLGEYSRVLFDRFAPTLVVGLGARMFAEAIGVPEAAFPPGTHLAAIGLDPSDQGRTYATDIAAVCDVRLGVRAIHDACRDRIDPARRAARIAAIEEIQGEHRSARERHLAEHRDDSPMSLARLATELNRAIDADTVIVEHGTTSTPVLMEHLRAERPRDFFATGSSVQGWGMPAAIGIQLARTSQRVLAIVGDGGFTFTPQALWTAGRYKVPVTVVVINNGGYRSMRSGVLRAAKRSAERGYDFGFDFQVDVASAARAFGVGSVRVTDPADVAQAVRTAMQDDAPSVIEIVISSNPFPWV